MINLIFAKWREIEESEEKSSDIGRDFIIEKISKQEKRNTLEREQENDKKSSFEISVKRKLVNYLFISLWKSFIFNFDS